MIDPKTVTLDEALQEYLTKVSILKKGYAQEKYRIIQLRRSVLGPKIVCEITSVDIAAYRDSRLWTINPRTNRLLATASVRLELALLSNFFEIARIEWGYCSSNPVSNVRKPKPAPGRDRRVTPREERQIVRWCTQRGHLELRTIFLFALETAMRQSEILGLAWERVNLKTRVVHLIETKNGTKRDVPLSLKARDLLVGMGPRSRGPVFSYSISGFKSSWRSMIKKLGIQELHFHDTRHEAASRFTELGTLDILEIAAITGHKSLAMLKRYTHLSAQRLAAKLEGRKNRGRAAVLEAMVPYPALVRAHEDGRFNVHLLDFDDLHVTRDTKDEALRAAADVLMRQLLRRMREDRPAPTPDAYLELVDESHIVMVDPLFYVD